METYEGCLPFCEAVYSHNSTWRWWGTPETGRIQMSVRTTLPFYLSYIFNPPDILRKSKMYNRWRFLFFYLNWYLDTNYVREESQTLKITKCNVGKTKRWQCFKSNVFLALYNLYLNLQLDRSIYSAPIAHFRFSKDVKWEQKYKKEKWQCSQNSHLNPTCAWPLFCVTCLNFLN